MNFVKKGDIYISDLTHTEQGIVARVFPLGASCIYSYAKEKLGSDFNFRLFIFPVFAKIRSDDVVTSKLKFW